MKAAFIKQTGDPNEIIIGELPMPEIHADEVLVKVKAVSINHVDTFVRSGVFKTDISYPFVVGRDAVGTVISVGSDVSNFQPGDQVWTNSMGYDGRQGTTSEFSSVSENRLYSIPENIDPIKLVASVHSSATAEIILNDILEVQAGKSILIEGAAGHVGSKLVAVAKIMGLKITTTSAERDFAELSKIGSDETYSYNQSISQIPNSFDYIVDTSGKTSLQDNIEKLNLGGQIGLITSPKNNRFEFRPRDFYMNLQSIKGFVISHASLNQLAEAASFINLHIKENYLLNDDVILHSYKDVAKAQEMLENGHNHRKRVVLTF